MNRKCKNCNEPLHSKDVFCTACGSPISSLSIEEQQDLAPQLTLEATFTPIEESSGLQPTLVTTPEPTHEEKTEPEKTVEAPAEKLPPSQEPTPEPVSKPKPDETANEKVETPDPALQPEPTLKTAIPQEDQGSTQWTPPPDPYKIKKKRRNTVILVVILILVALIAGWVFWYYTKGLPEPMMTEVFYEYL